MSTRILFLFDEAELSPTKGIYLRISDVERAEDIKPTDDIPGEYHQRALLR